MSSKYSTNFSFNPNGKGLSTILTNSKPTDHTGIKKAQDIETSDYKFLDSSCSDISYANISKISGNDRDLFSARLQSPTTKNAYVFTDSDPLSPKGFATENGTKVLLKSSKLLQDPYSASNIVEKDKDVSSLLESDSDPVDKISKNKHKRNYKDLSSRKYIDLQEEPEYNCETSPKKPSPNCVQNQLQDNQPTHQEIAINEASEVRLNNDRSNIPENEDQAETRQVHNLRHGSMPLHDTQNVAGSQLQSQNSNVSDAALINLQQPAHPLSPTIIRYDETEVKIYLRKVLGLFLALILCSIIYKLMIRYKGPPQMIFLVISVYLFYVVLVDTLFKQGLLESAWLGSDDRFNSMDMVFANIFVFLMNLKLLGLLPLSTIGSFSFLFSTMCYTFLSDTPIKARIRGILQRWLYFLQALIITLKLDDFVDWRWEIIFTISLVYFAAKSLYCIKYSVSAFKSAVSLFRNIEDYPIALMELSGFIWCLAYHGLLNLAGGLVLLGISQAYNSTNDFELLMGIADFAIWLNCFLCIYTIVTWKYLVKFIVKFKLIDSNLERFAAMHSKKDKKRIINFLTEKKEYYFAMLSSTYFMPLQQSFLMNGKRSLNKIKTMFKAPNSVKSNKKDNQKSQFEQGVDIEALKKYKEDLDIKLSKIGENGFRVKPKANQRLNTVAEGQQVRINSEGDIDKKDDMQSGHKYSERYGCDTQQNDFAAATIRSNNDEEVLCYLCYANLPNAVLLSCGHGGICYECAIALVNHKNECMECRKEVEAIYRIDPKPKMSNIIKGLEINKISVSHQ